MKEIVDYKIKQERLFPFLFCCDPKASRRLARVAGFVANKVSVSEAKPQMNNTNTNTPAAERYVISNTLLTRNARRRSQRKQEKKERLFPFLFCCDPKASRRLARVAGFVANKVSVSEAKPQNE